MRGSIIILPEDTKMRFHPKGGIEHRQYPRLKNVVASVRGFPRQGGLRVGQGKTCQTLIFSQCCAKSVANQPVSTREGSSQPRTATSEKRRLPAETCFSVLGRAPPERRPTLDESGTRNLRCEGGRAPGTGSRGKLVTFCRHFE